MVLPMNTKLSQETALRIQAKLKKYLQLVSQIEKLEKDPDLQLIIKAQTIPQVLGTKGKTRTWDSNPIKPAIKYIEEVFFLLPEGTVLDTWEVLEKIKAIGFTSTADKIYLTIYGILRRESQKQDTKIEKVGSKWRLKLNETQEKESPQTTRETSSILS